MEGEAAASEDQMVVVAAAVVIWGSRGRFKEDSRVVEAGVGDYPIYIFAEQAERARAVGPVVDNPGRERAGATVALDGAQQLDVGDRESAAEGALEGAQI